MTPAAVAYPPLYASGGPAGGQTVAFDPREQGDGLRPKPLPHSGSVGSFQGRQGPGLRPSPGRPVSSLRCGPRQPPLRPLTPFPLEKRSGSATAARRGRFRGLTYPTPPQDRKTRCRPVSAPLNERMTGQGRNAATAGWCGPQPGTGEDSGQTWRTLDAAAAARASRRGSRGGLLTPAPRRLAGESGRAEGSALCPSPQGAEQVAPKASLTRVASARPGARCRRSGAAVRYESRLHIVSVLYIISVLIRFAQIRYERSNDHGTSGHHF